MTMTQDAPTAILIRKDRAPSSRKRKIAVFVALIVGLPGLALAATYLFTVVTGQATLNTANQTMRIAAVTGSPADPVTGVDCSQSSKIDNGTVNLRPAAQSLTINIGDDGGVVGGTPQVSAGTCTVDILVENNGPKDVHVTSQAVLPAGWTIDVPPVDILRSSQGHLIATITATEAATTGPITGSLALELLPAP